MKPKTKGDRNFRTPISSFGSQEPQEKVSGTGSKINKKLMILFVEKI